MSMTRKEFIGLMLSPLLIPLVKKKEPKTAREILAREEFGKRFLRYPGGYRGGKLSSHRPNMIIVDDLEFESTADNAWYKAWKEKAEWHKDNLNAIAYFGNE